MGPGKAGTGPRMHLPFPGCPSPPSLSPTPMETLLRAPAQAAFGRTSPVDQAFNSEANTGPNERGMRPSGHEFDTLGLDRPSRGLAEHCPRVCVCGGEDREGLRDPWPRPHSLRPPLEGGDGEEGHHGRQHVVEVEVAEHPLAAAQLHLRGVPVLVDVVVAPSRDWGRGHCMGMAGPPPPRPHVLRALGSECAGHMEVPVGAEGTRLGTILGGGASSRSPSLKGPSCRQPPPPPESPPTLHTCIPPPSSWTGQCS